MYDNGSGNFIATECWGSVGAVSAADVEGMAEEKDATDDIFERADNIITINEETPLSWFVITDLGMLPYALRIIHNMSVHENRDQEYKLARTVDLFYYFDRYIDPVTIETCNYTGEYIKLDGYSYPMTRDNNVLVSPSWTWQNYYAAPYARYPVENTYTVSAGASVFLTPSLYPTQTFDITRSF